MLGEALSALASAGGTALVGAMVSDGWEGLRARFARLLGHGDATKIASAGVRLEEARVVLAELAGEYFGGIAALSGAAYKLEMNLAQFYRRHLAPSHTGQGP